GSGDACDPDHDLHDSIACGGDDCDDTSSFRHPGRPEVCDTLDNDCNGMVDDGVSLTLYRDADGDGFGATSMAMMSCGSIPGTSPTDGDCDDSVASIHPGAVEACDRIDNDC